MKLIHVSSDDVAHGRVLGTEEKLSNGYSYRTTYYYPKERRKTYKK